MAQAQAQVPHPPFEGAQLVIGTIAVSLAVFMNVLDTSIANVSIPSISGRPRRFVRSGHVGDHLVRGGERDLRAADRLAHRAHRPGAPVHGVDRAVRDLVVDVRPRADAAVPARLARAARRRGRSDDSAVANPAARQLSAREGADGALDVGDDHADCAGGRTDSGRLDLGQHLVAVDLLRQHSGRRDRRDRDVDDLPQSRFGDPQGADRRRGARRC